MDETERLLNDLQHNHIAIGREESIYSRAAREIRRLRPYEAIAKSYRELPYTYHQGMLELLVQAAFEHAAISTGRAAELLQCGIMDIREKGWIQGRKDEQIQGLQDDLEEARSLLREAVEAWDRADGLMRFDEWRAAVLTPDWRKRAAAAAGGDS